MKDTYGKSESSYQNCFEEIINRIDSDRNRLTNRELLEICRETADFLSGETNPHLCHEIAETALNFLIKRKYAKNLLSSKNPADAVQYILKPLAARLPTETWRSTQQNIWQQFSTPPAIAYLLAYLLNLQVGEAVLESSAGTGGLAVWSSGIGLLTHTNEIDSRRRFLLEQIGFSPTSFNAEFIDDFLPTEITADCVMMNPPFSSNGERTKNNSSKFGFRHARSALERLKKGGKFGIILGNSAGLDTRTGNEFWGKLSENFSVKSIIKIAGKEYSKNGTRVDVNLIIGRKHQSEQQNDWNDAKRAITNVSVTSVEEGFAAALKLKLRLN